MQRGYLACALDMLNVRDLDLLAQARAHCDVLTVGVLTDDDVAACTGRPPVITLEERLFLAEHLHAVDRTVVHRDAEWDLLDNSVITMVVRGESDWLRPDADVVLTPQVVSDSTALRTAISREAELV